MTEFREVERRDLPACAAAMYEAFRDIAPRHDFPPDFPSPDAAEGLLGHNRSLCLYAKLGFAATEMLSNMTGDGIAARVSGRAVRAAESVDVQACNALCREVHGFDRAGELANAVDAFDGPGILIPTANGELFRWCLDHGLRLVQQMTLMDTVPSGAPNGVHWPAVLC